MGSAESPRISPNGRFTTYDVQTEKTFDVYIIPGEGGATQCLSDSKMRDTVPSWKVNGETILSAQRYQNADSIMLAEN